MNKSERCAGVPVVDMAPVPVPSAMPTYQVILLLKLNVIHMLWFLQVTEDWAAASEPTDWAAQSTPAAGDAAQTWGGSTWD